MSFTTRNPKKDVNKNQIKGCIHTFESSLSSNHTAFKKTSLSFKLSPPLPAD